MIIGFTGTREGMTVAQKESLRNILAQLLPIDLEFHHGGCVGADEEAHLILLELFAGSAVVHPGLNRAGKVAARGQYPKAEKILEPKFFLDRNKDIVDASQWLIAVPATYHESVRSGTWSTVRYARKEDKPVTI